jgi:methionine synthase II (cobalamin-independent)
MIINKHISIEDLITKYPESIHDLMQKGIRCLICGEPMWGTLEEAAKEKGLTDAEINLLVAEIKTKYQTEPSR